MCAYLLSFVAVLFVLGVQYYWDRRTPGRDRDNSIPDKTDCNQSKKRRRRKAFKKQTAGSAPPPSMANHSQSWLQKQAPEGLADGKVRRVYFIRHGQGKHNLEKAARWTADPSLTVEGVAQVRRSAESLFRGAEERFLPQIIITSPLRRTIETTLLVLEALRKEAGLHPRVLVTPLLSESWSARYLKNKS